MEPFMIDKIVFVFMWCLNLDMSAINTANHPRKPPPLGKKTAFVCSEIRMKPEKVSIIIRACAVLHNIAILRKEPLDGYAKADDQPNLVCFCGPDHICNTFF